MFHYQTGEEVLLGDRIQYSAWQGIVEFIIKPQTKLAEDYSAPNGGVMLLFYAGGRMLLDTVEDEEDLVFVGRFDDSVLTEFGNQGRLCEMCYSDGELVRVGDEVEDRLENGNLIRACVAELYKPFSKEAWDRTIPMGGLVVLLTDGTTKLYTQIPSSMQLKVK